MMTAIPCQSCGAVNGLFIGDDNICSACDVPVRDVWRLTLSHPLWRDDRVDHFFDLADCAAALFLAATNDTVTVSVAEVPVVRDWAIGGWRDNDGTVLNITRVTPDA